MGSPVLPVLLSTAAVATSAFFPPAAIALALAAGAVTAFGQVREGQAASDASKFQARVARNNAILADRAAEDARQRGAVEEQQVRAQGRRFIGTQKAAFAASGLDIAAGTPVDIFSSQAGINELDALTIQSNTAREIAGFQLQGQNLRSEADLLRSQAQNQRTAGTLSATSTLLSTGSQVAASWHSFKGPPSTGTALRTNTAGRLSGPV
ncbi:MAG: hypothetical protein MN733_16165 [Nitrososphaera sp.]|nr:hypothetical protein [Nitrososphaera sp.]